MRNPTPSPSDLTSLYTLMFWIQEARVELSRFENNKKILQQTINKMYMFLKLPLFVKATV